MNSFASESNNIDRNYSIKTEFNPGIYDPNKHLLIPLDFFK
jgi:hypothetical protein